VRRKRSVLVAAGITFGRDSSFGLSAGRLGGGGILFTPASGIKLFSTFAEDGVVYDAADIREGATVDGGGVKNERSSKVSRKSLYVKVAIR
jgi:hypothetical protein